MAPAFPDTVRGMEEPVTNRKKVSLGGKLLEAGRLPAQPLGILQGRGAKQPPVFAAELLAASMSPLISILRASSNHTCFWYWRGLIAVTALNRRCSTEALM